MIAFVSLFLGLVLGPQVVEVTVGDEVAAVVLQLDGAELARLTEAPWRTTVDLGSDLVPHRLEAVALDAQGETLATVVQWLNLPQPPARANVVVDAGDDQRPPTATLAWESVAGGEPTQLTVSFDGRPLTVTDPQRIELPRYDPSQLHFFRAEITFSENVRSVVEATVGGTYSDQVSTELTAIALRTDTRKKPLTVDQLAGKILHRGQPLRVVAVDHTTPTVLFVPDRDMGPGLRRLHKKAPTSGGMMHPADPNHSLRFWTRVDGEPNLRVVWPMHRQQEGASINFQLFPTSQEIDGRELGLFNLLLLAQRPPDRGDASHHSAEAPQRLADAVAVAGLEAAGRRRPRAVVLVIGKEPVDRSSLTMAQARRYLAHLQVPLEVWALERKAVVPEAWGPVRNTAQVHAFERAAKDLGRLLERQWIAWVDGTYRPQDIHLAPDLDDVALLP